MTTNARSMAVGVFTDDAQAQQAMTDLQQAGFSNNQIRYSVRRSGTGITDSLENLGLSEEEATFYNQEFENGRTIVTVNTSDRQQEAYDILRRNGAYDFSSRSAQTANYASTANYTSTTATDMGAQRVQLREEELRAQKQPVQTGEVGLRKEVVSEQQTIDVPVTREEVYIERRPASGQPSDTPIGEGETYRVPVREEQVTVEKQPVVREEVALGKRQVQDTQRVSDTVRREEAHIEQSGDVNVQGSDVVDDQS
jgi:uncharacterized protein (TIGR02271 family)